MVKNLQKKVQNLMGMDDNNKNDSQMFNSTTNVHISNLQTPHRREGSNKKSMMRTASGGYEIIEGKNGMSDFFATKDLTRGGQMSVGGKAYSRK
jgi:hypothetical protein